MTRRSKERPEAKRARVARLVAGLRALYPDADCELTHRSALELLVATILSAQCTDERVNKVTPALFARYKTAADYASADPRELETLIHSTGFFRNKAKSIIGLGKALAERHGGHVPDTMEELVTLPGIGRKTANVLLCAWFRRPAVPVDTHVQRLAGRLGLTDETAPEKIEAAIQSLVPESDWSFTATALIWHGRRVCAARHPACDRCTLRPDCPYPA
ncbi:MAG TPA: endonuclease III [Candidatus Sulfotelmatobacter sp.]|jgi:endonuclease-3|nr:endonuclease III [Candidatus Sulfotelmatobacter sp.]